MYNHRAPKNRVDVVDLDPYGTAAPFIDAAVQCVNDGGKTTPAILLSVISDEILETRPPLCHLYGPPSPRYHCLPRKMVSRLAALP